MQPNAQTRRCQPLTSLVSLGPLVLASLVSCGGGSSSGSDSQNPGPNPPPPPPPPTGSLDVDGRWLVAGIIPSSSCPNLVNGAPVFDWTLTTQGGSLSIDLQAAVPDPDPVVTLSGTLQADGSFAVQAGSGSQYTSVTGSLAVSGSGSARTLTVTSTWSVDDEDCGPSTASFELFGIPYSGATQGDADLSGAWTLDHRLAAFNASCAQGYTLPPTLQVSLQESSEQDDPESTAYEGSEASGATVQGSSSLNAGSLVFLWSGDPVPTALVAIFLTNGERLIGVTLAQQASCGAAPVYLALEGRRASASSAAPPTERLSLANATAVPQAVLLAPPGGAPRRVATLPAGARTRLELPRGSYELGLLPIRGGDAPAESITRLHSLELLAPTALRIADPE